MAAITLFKKRQIAQRSTSDIDRLAKQYKSNISGITGDYADAFTQYSGNVASAQKTYDEQKQIYDNNYKNYLNIVDTYNTSANAYRTAMASYTERFNASGEKTMEAHYTYGKTRTNFWINGAEPFTNDVKTNPKNYGFEYVISPYDAGRKGTQTWTVKPLFEEKPPTAPTVPANFSDKAPEVPVAPNFDSTQFDARKTQAGDTFNREVGERRAAKLGAVSRRGARPLLSGAQA